VPGPAGSNVALTRVLTAEQEAVLDIGMPRLRDLPWRRTRDPWAVLVSEVMLQQTPVARVVPRWERFLDRWPTVTDAADAPLPGLLGSDGLPLTSPVGLDPGLDGTYPILGDPSLGMPEEKGGLVSDLMSAANQLGAGQAIDLLKGVVIPSIAQAAQGAGPAIAAPAPPLP